MKNQMAKTEHNPIFSFLKKETHDKDFLQSRYR